MTNCEQKKVKDRVSDKFDLMELWS